MKEITSTASNTSSNNPISQDLLSALGIEELFPFQRWLIGRLQCPDCGDLAISAPTGSGKTLAYVLPILLALKERRIRSVVRALVVVPVKDLIGQVEETVRVVSEALGLAGLGSAVQVCTPGRLADLLEQDQRQGHFKALEWLVVDEADRLLEHSTQSVWLPHLLECLSNDDKDAGEQEAWMHRCKKLLFSATLTKNPSKLAPLQLTRPELLLVRNELVSDDADAAIDDEGGLMTPAALREGIVVLAGKDAMTWKLGALVHVLSEPGAGKGKVLIFCRSTDTAIQLNRFLNRAMALVGRDSGNTGRDGGNTGRDDGNTVINGNSGNIANSGNIPIAEAFHAHLNPQQRTALLETFKSSPHLRYLVSTDALARGIHLPNISLVINYDFPAFSSTYVHRVGRTARAGAKGVALTLLPANAMQHAKRILEGGLGKRVRQVRVEKGQGLVHVIEGIGAGGVVGKVEMGERELEYLWPVIESTMAEK